MAGADELRKRKGGAPAAAAASAKRGAASGARRKGMSEATKVNIIASVGCALVLLVAYQLAGEAEVPGAGARRAPPRPPSGGAPPQAPGGRAAPLQLGKVPKEHRKDFAAFAQSAIKAQMAGDLATAEKQLEGAVALSEAVPEVMTMLANLLLRRGYDMTGVRKPDAVALKRATALHAKAYKLINKSHPQYAKLVMPYAHALAMTEDGTGSNHKKLLEVLDSCSSDPHCKTMRDKYVAGLAQAQAQQAQALHAQQAGAAQVDASTASEDAKNDDEDDDDDE
jgi:hypothetical protein